MGFSLDAEFFIRTEQDAAAAATGEDGSVEPVQPGFFDQSLTNMGLCAQAGHVVAEQYLPVVRYERLMPEGDHNDKQVFTAGFGAFLFQHSLKLQTEASLISSESLDDATGVAGWTTDWRVRTQLQLAF